MRFHAPRVLSGSLTLLLLAVLCPAARPHVLYPLPSFDERPAAAAARDSTLQILTAEDFRRGLLEVHELSAGQISFAEVWNLPHQLSDDPESLDAVQDQDFLICFVAGFFGQKPLEGESPAAWVSPPEEDFVSPPPAGHDFAPRRTNILSFVAVGAAALGAGTLLRRRT